MRERQGARWPAAGLALIVALAGACSGSEPSDAGDDDAGPDSPATDDVAAVEPFTGPDFYDVPDPLPGGEHGTLIRYEPVEGVDLGGAAVWRVMYLSEDVAGEPIAVTGVVGIPAGDAPRGGRPVVSLAHGTTGVADECAPSKQPEGGGMALLRPFLDAGYLVAQTDYEGLGTPGRHPYLVGESEGRGVLDAARAAASLPEAEPGEQLAIFGYSQGGHGALWAGQLAPEWVPELDLVGTVAGAPATELPLIFAAGGRLPIAGFLYMIIAGFGDAYPDAPLSAVLTPAGEAELPAVDDGCTRDVIGHFAGMDSSALLVPGGAGREPWASLAADNNPGNVRTDEPVLILHSAADEVVPAGLSASLFERMCGLGQVVERRVYENGHGHGAAAPGAVADGLAWIEQRFAGEAAISTCPAAP
ncbi:MAG TPA: lipase family protein [Acidimicrobiales bacterium]|nr:lipase family protein [Acidimicrobiales bacterium]